MRKLPLLISLSVVAAAPAKAGVIIYTAGVDFGGASFGGGEATGVAEYVSNFGATAADFAGFTPGRIAVIDRGGGVFFTEKVQNAQDAGAVGVIILDAPPFNASLDMGGSNPTVTIPSVRISQALGDALRAELQGSPSTPITFHLGLSPLILERLVAIPEPSTVVHSLVLLGVAGVGWGRRVAWRNKKAA